VRIVDQWCLLNVVMAGQFGGRGELWEKAFIRVNLHPHHKLPIDVWLSRIQDKIVASGGTAAGASNPYGPEFLKLIKVPAVLDKLTRDEQLELRELTRSSDFDWSIAKLKELSPKYCSLLSQRGAFHEYFKFKNSMTKALEKGLVLPDDISPRAALDRAAEAGMLSSDPPPRPVSQLEQNKLNMRDVGHSSYNKLGRPGLSPEEQFKAMCRHRSRFARDDPLPSRGLHLMHSADQERRIFNVTARDFSIGAMLDGALLINAGKRHGARTINLLGESEGVACIVNDPKRLLLLQQAATLSESMASLLQSRAAAKEDKGAGRAKKAAAKLTSEAAELPILQLLKSDGVLPWGAAPGSLKLTLPPLKRYIAKHKLQRLLPKVPKKSARPNLMVFLQELCAQVILLV
jgi:hypothetical protein